MTALTNHIFSKGLVTENDTKELIKAKKNRLMNVASIFQKFVVHIMQFHSIQMSDMIERKEPTRID